MTAHQTIEAAKDETGQETLTGAELVLRSLID